MITQLLFTKSTHWISDLICEVLREPISHVSIRVGNTVYQSNMRGVHRLPYAEFMAQQESCIKITVQNIPNIEETFDKYQNSWYDIGAFFFLGFSFLIRRYLGIPLPKSNLWQATGMFLCTEWVAEVLDREEDAMLTPYQLYQELRDYYYGS